MVRASKVRYFGSKLALRSLREYLVETSAHGFKYLVNGK